MKDLRFRPASPDDRAPLAEFLAGLSAETAYLRFLTGQGGAPSPSLVAGLLPEEPRGGALLGLFGEDLVAHGLWVAIDEPGTAEIALVVADAHQRRGIGSRLARALAVEVAAQGLETVRMLTVASNRAVPRMVAHLAPAATHELDGTTLTYTVPLGPVSSTVRPLVRRGDRVEARLRPSA
jgi:GNAT superfamily N-acetyltransferase